MPSCNNSTAATLLSGMTVVNDATRQQLMNKIPNTAAGSTCIGCGLQIAIDVKFTDAKSKFFKSYVHQMLTMW